MSSEDRSLIETMTRHAAMPLSPPPQPISGDPPKDESSIVGAGATPPMLGHDGKPMQPGDQLIGFFQAFRPAGDSLGGYFASLASPSRWDESLGRDLDRRLTRLYAAAGDDHRPGGGRDVYFVVRQPPRVNPNQVESWGRDWLGGIASIGEALSMGDAVRPLRPIPAIRVLEGIPPKAPRRDEDKTTLLRLLQRQMGDALVRCISDDVAISAARTLGSAYYFIACDPMLRDYLMWPLFRRHAPLGELDDPLAPYFEMWRHGVKWRVFQAGQVDFYLPRLRDDTA